MRRIPWVILGWIVLVTAVHAASFDCGKAASQMERLICSDSQLSKSDEDLAASYSRALKEVLIKGGQHRIVSRGLWQTKAKSKLTPLTLLWQTAPLQTRMHELE